MERSCLISQEERKEACKQLLFSTRTLSEKAQASFVKLSVSPNL